MKALVIGRAATVWDEVAQAKSLTTFDKVVVINVAGCNYPGAIDYWVSYHPDFLAKWIEQRQRAGYPYSIATTQLWSGIHRGRKLGSKGMKVLVSHFDWSGGSSGLLAVMVARQAAQCDKIVLCGIPMENTSRYDDTRPWREAMSYRQAWLDAKAQLAPYLRSMSGWTKEQFGEPTKEWLDVATLEEHQVGADAA